MELETTNTRENPLLDRVEVDFLIHHPGETTPPRAKVRELLASETGKPKNAIVVDRLRSEFGRAVSKGFAKCYDSEAAAQSSEPKHLLVRNDINLPAKKGASTEAE